MRDYRTEDFDLVDLYVTYNEIEANFIKSMLDENDIACFVRNLQPGQFPMSVGKHGQFRIVVDHVMHTEARKVIEDAIAEDAITDEGNFL